MKNTQSFSSSSLKEKEESSEHFTRQSTCNVVKCRCIIIFRKFLKTLSMNSLNPMTIIEILNN